MPALRFPGGLGGFKVLMFLAWLMMRIAVDEGPGDTLLVEVPSPGRNPAMAM